MVRQIAIVIWLVSVGVASAADWPHWAGPKGDCTTDQRNGYRLADRLLKFAFRIRQIDVSDVTTKAPHGRLEMDRVLGVV